MSMPAASGCTNCKVRSSLWIFRIVSRRCLRFIWCQLGWVDWPVAFGAGSFGVAFMVTSRCSIQRGSARLTKTAQSLHRGRAILLLRTTPATIYTIVSTGAMLKSGRNAPKNMRP